MLLRKDVDRLFHLAQKKGARACELYAESNVRLTCDFKDRIAHTASHRSGGTKLVMDFPFGPRTFFTSTTNLAALEDLLEGTSRFEVSTETPKPGALPANAHVQKTFRNLDRALKQSQLDCSLIRELDLAYADECVEFTYADTEGRFATGERTSAEWTGHAVLQKDDRSVRLTTQRASGQRNLTDDLENRPLFSQTDLKLCFQPTWPFPQGEIPLLWSSTALAKIIFLLGRSLEGDLASTDRSWISSVKMPLLRFSLRQHFGLENTFDQEGTARGPMVLLERGQIQGVLTDRRFAETLGVSGSGNCRRASCLLPPTLAPSHLEVLGTEKETDLLAKTERGIHVDDIRVLGFSFATSELELEISRARLIHHGLAGDPLDPLVFKIHLPDLLASLKIFGAESETEGLWLVKNQSRLLVEISTPVALSQGLVLPGTVPLQHYW